MTIYDVIMCVGFALQILTCVVIGLPFKRRKTCLLYVFPITTVMYCVTIYVSKISSLWWLACIMEVFSMWVVLKYCNSGNIWRNYIFLWIACTGSNLVLAGESIVINLLLKKGSYILTYGPTDLIGIIVEDLLLIVDTFILSLIIRRFSKKEYKGDGRIFFILFLVMFLVAAINGYIRDCVVNDYNKTHKEVAKSDIFLYIFLVLGVYIIANILMYVYNKLEIFRLKKIKTELQTMLSYNSEQYRELAEKNQRLATIKENIVKYKENLQTEGDDATIGYLDELCTDEEAMTMLPLSGSVAVDAILSDFYNQYSAKGMVLEFHVEQLAQVNMADIDAAVLFDNLLKLAKTFCEKKGSEGWTLLNTKMAGESVVIKLEFNKRKEDKLEAPKRFEIIKRAGTSGNELRIVRKITQLYHGTLDMSDMGEEGAISLLIQGHTGE